MVQEVSTLEEDPLFLLQTKNKDLEHLFSDFIQEKDVRLESVERSENVSQQQPAGQIITFIIGSDVDDPIQSAQRLHAYRESAKMVLLSKTEQDTKNLKETIKFSPFLGVDVTCLNESNKAKLKESLEQILQESLQAEKYRDLLEETNSQISLAATAEQPAYNQNFINRLMDVAPIGIAIVGQEGKVLGWNQAAASIFKVTEARVLGTPLFQLFDRMEGSKLKGYLREIFAKGNTEPINTLTLKRESDDLSNQILNFTASSFKYSEGKEKALILTIQDVTERKQSEQALRKNEEKYRTLVEHFPRGVVCLFDENLRYTAVGGELMSSVGVDPEDRIGNKVSDIYPEEIVEDVEPYFKAALEGESGSFEAKLHGRHLFAHTLPIKDEDGKIFAGMLVVQDITERWQAQQDLRESEEKYRTLFEKMDEGFGIIQMEFNDSGEPVNFHYLETNSAYQKHSGVNITEGDSAREVLPNFGEDMLRRNGNVALTGEPYHQEFYVEELGRWLDLAAFRIGKPEERKVAVLLQNITERRQVQEELKELNETLEDRVEKRTQALLSYQSQLRSLASQLSKAEEKERQRLAGELHDNLGQMLAVSKMKMDLLPDDQLPDATAEEIKKIKQGMDDAIVYTRNLMSDLKPPPSLDKEDITATIEWVAELMEKHELDVTVEDDGEPKRAREEIRTTLLQSVRELLFNVIKHTDENEAIVRMSRLDDQVQIMVEDQGKGMDPDISPSATTEEGGFGLFNIAERMDLLGGSIEIDSEPDEGTTVILKAPLKNGDKMDVPAASGLKEAPPMAKEIDQEIKVMLVDDHTMMREGLKKIVEAEDDLMVIAEASDGGEAVELARETSPDIIVMDVNMPHMNGIDATQEIMQMKPEVRVIGLSLHGHQSVVASMKDAGATAFLSKEEAFETLSATIRGEANVQ